MPVFNDSENVPQFQPEGDYVFRVDDFTIGISKGGKTAGAEKYDLELALEPSNSKLFETLVDHESCVWKIDTFLKSAGIKLAKGQPFSFRRDEAESNGWAWVNPIGLRGWCRVFVDEYNGKKRNKVTTFYTDRPKLAPVVPVETEEDTPF